MMPVEKVRRIVRNRLRCLLCYEVIESRFRHNFVACKCGNAFLDGGTSYVRYGWEQSDAIELMTEYEDVEE